MVRLRGFSKTMKSVVLYYPLYSRWDFPEYPFLFKEPNKAACWAISRFKQDGLGNAWGQGKYPQFLSFVSQVMMKRCEVQVALESPTIKRKSFLQPSDIPSSKEKSNPTKQ
jgi:hypothetical protein